MKKENTIRLANSSYLEAIAELTRWLCVKAPATETEPVPIQRPLPSTCAPWHACLSPQQSKYTQTCNKDYNSTQWRGKSYLLFPFL